jgi:hypothetical protein
VSADTNDGANGQDLQNTGATLPAGAQINATAAPNEPDFTSTASYNLSSSSLQFSATQTVGSDGGLSGGPASSFSFEMDFTVPVETAFTVSGAYSFNPLNRVELLASLTDETIQDQIFQAGEITGLAGYTGSPFNTDGSGFLLPGDVYQFTGDYVVYGGNAATSSGSIRLDAGPAAIPEPDSAALFGVAGMTLLFRRTRKSAMLSSC